MLGAYITKIARTRRKRKIVTRSLKIKLGAIGSLSAFPVTPRGLFEPCSCSVRICITASAARMKGSTKWRLKNLFRVALFTLNPPQINSTRSPPTHGMALIRFVITVARLPIIVLYPPPPLSKVGYYPLPQWSSALATSHRFLISYPLSKVLGLLLYLQYMTLYSLTLDSRFLYWALW
jgi:hypothetical protein